MINIISYREPVTYLELFPEGECAILLALNHPICGLEQMQTSRITWKRPDGVFLTRNSLYTPEGAPEMFNYAAQLKGFDWQYEFTDDQTVWQRRLLQRKELEKVRERIDPSGMIWNVFATEHYQIEGAAK